MQCLLTDLIILTPVLKNTSYVTQFFHVLFQQQSFNFFKINLYVLAEEIIAANITEV